MRKSILAESRSRGWVSAESAPPRIQARIAEIRRAILAGKPIPQPSAEYRSFAEASLKKLFSQGKRPMSIEDKFVAEFGYEPRRLSQQVDAHVETLRKELAVLGIF